MKKILLSACCILWLTAGFAQTDAERLQQLDQYIEQARQQWEVPGLGVTIVKDGEVIHAKGYGVRNIETGQPANTQTLFAICSTTKAMVAAAMGLLVDEGKLDWDDRVIDHLPEFRVADEYITKEMRIRELFTHNTGMGNTDLLWIQGMPSDEIFRRLRYAEPIYSFRAGFVYHNNMYLAAGKVMERVSGMPWEDFMIERLFKPLGMNRTFPMKKYVEGKENVSTAYHYVDGRIQPIEDWSVDNAAPAGAIWSCLGDMAKWVRFMLNEGAIDGQPLLKPQTFAELLKPQTLFPGARFYPALQLKKPHVTTYSLGWFQYDHDGRFASFHTGSLPGTIAIIGIIPDEDLGVYLWGNLDHAEVRHALMYKIFDVFSPEGDNGRDYSTEVMELFANIRERQQAAIARQEAEREANTQPSRPLAAYAGVYTHPLIGELTVEAEGEDLLFQLGDIPYRATHWHYDTFAARATNQPWQAGHIPVTFRLDERGAVQALEALGYTFEKRSR